MALEGLSNSVNVANNPTIDLDSINQIAPQSNDVMSIDSKEILNNKSLAKIRKDKFETAKERKDEKESVVDQPTTSYVHLFETTQAKVLNEIAASTNDLNKINATRTQQYLKFSVDTLDMANKKNLEAVVTGVIGESAKALTNFAATTKMTLGNNKNITKVQKTADQLTQKKVELNQVKLEVHNNQIGVNSGQLGADSMLSNAKLKQSGIEAEIDKLAHSDHMQNLKMNQAKNNYQLLGAGAGLAGEAINGSAQISKQTQSGQAKSESLAAEILKAATTNQEQNAKADRENGIKAQEAINKIAENHNATSSAVASKH